MSKIKGKQIESNSLDLDKLRAGNKFLPDTSTLGSVKTVSEITNPNEFITKNYVDTLNVPFEYNGTNSFNYITVNDNTQVFFEASNVTNPDIAVAMGVIADSTHSNASFNTQTTDTSANFNVESSTIATISMDVNDAVGSNSITVSSPLGNFIGIDIEASHSIAMQSNGSMSFTNNGTTGSINFNTSYHNGVTSNKAIAYLGDYSASYTNRSLPDKAYVDRLSANSTSGLATEIARATAAELALSNAITAEASTRGAVNQTIINLINTGLAAEASTRGAADQTIINNLTTLINNGLTAEASTRGASYLTLQNLINTSIAAEASTRGAADQSIINNLTTLINNAITSEASTRGAADQTIINLINTSIAAEASTRGAADQSIINNLTTLINNSISAEASTRGAVDTNLQLQINAINTASTAGLANEIARATAAEGVIAGNLSTFIATKGQPLGLAPLDGSGKVSEAYLPDSIVGQVEYKGTFNASSGSVPVASSSGNKGWYYIIDTDGIISTVDYKVGDWIISNGSSWNKVDNSDAVTTVFGRIGNILANSGDYNATQITNSSSGNITSVTVQGAINELDSHISSEVSRATSAEGTISGNLTSEISRATSAEGVIAGNLTSEISRATSAENALTNAILAEASTRGQIDAYLQSQINSLGSSSVYTEGNGIDITSNVISLDIIDYNDVNEISFTSSNLNGITFTASNGDLSFEGSAGATITTTGNNASLTMSTIGDDANLELNTTNGDVTIEASGLGSEILLDTTNAGSITLTSGSNFNITTSEGIIINGTKNAKYAADYGSNFSTRSLVDKGYVDLAVQSAVSNNSLNANIWLELSGYGISGTTGNVSYAGSFTFATTAVTDAYVYVNGVKLTKTQYYFTSAGNYKPTTGDTLYVNVENLGYEIDSNDTVEVEYLA